MESWMERVIAIVLAASLVSGYGLTVAVKVEAFEIDGISLATME